MRVNKNTRYKKKKPRYHVCHMHWKISLQLHHLSVRTHVLHKENKRGRGCVIYQSMLKGLMEKNEGIQNSRDGDDKTTVSLSTFDAKSKQVSGCCYYWTLMVQCKEAIRIQGRHEGLPKYNRTSQGQAFKACYRKNVFHNMNSEI